MTKFSRLLPRYDSLDTSGSNADATLGENTGRNAIASFDPQTVSGAEKTSTGTGAGQLGGQLNGQTGQYVSDYSKAVAANPTVTQLYNQGNEQFGVPQQAAQVANTENQVNNAIPAGYGAARGFDISSDQINNGIAGKTAYLTPQLNAERNNLNVSQQLAQGFVNAGQTQNSQNLLPIQAEAPLLNTSEQAQGNVWNTATQNELQGLIEKMNAGVTLSGNELNRANQLAALEEGYQANQVSQNSAIKQAQIGQEYKTLNPAQTLINTFTNTPYTAHS